MPRFRPYHIFDWLGTVPVTNKVYRKVMTCQSGLDSFTVVIKCETTGLLVMTSYPYSNVKLRVKTKNLVVRLNQQNDFQQGDQCPRHLACRIFGLITSSTDWVQYRWKIMFTRKWRVTKAVSLLHCCDKNMEQPVFQCWPLTFSWKFFVLIGIN